MLSTTSISGHIPLLPHNTRNRVLGGFIIESTGTATVPTVSQSTVLQNVEYILASGNGTLDFAVDGDDEYHTWRGHEEAEWTIEDVGRVENTDEDRLVVYPGAKYFICDIRADSEESNDGPVRCYCEESR
jgi:hypothetical protein